MEEDKLPVTDHLEELRRRLIKCLLAVAVGFVLSYSFSKQLFDLLTWPLLQAMPEDGKLIYTSLQVFGQIDISKIIINSTRLIIHGLYMHGLIITTKYRQNTVVRITEYKTKLDILLTVEEGRRVSMFPRGFVSD